jgi:circadian clock protein KaiB
MMATDDVIEFRLYIAGDLPNSRRAIVNLREFCREHFPDRHKIEILDVFKEPLRAIDDRILLTPQVVVLHQRGRRAVVGDLADHPTLRLAVDSVVDIK